MRQLTLNFQAVAAPSSNSATKRPLTQDSDEESSTQQPPTKMSKDGVTPTWVQAILEGQEQMKERIQSNPQETKGLLQQLTDRVTKVEARIGDLEAKDGSHSREVSFLKSELLSAYDVIEKLKKASATITDETRKRNILLMGIPESETTEDERFHMAQSHIQQVTGMEIPIDTTYRVGNRTDLGRPLVVTLHSMTDRNAILGAAKHNAQPGSRPSIKADLCVETRDRIQRNWEAKQPGFRPNHPP